MIKADMDINAETTITVRGPDGKIKHQQTVKAELLPAFFNWLKGVMKGWQQ
jgi:hypothetical protein